MNFLHILFIVLDLVFSLLFFQTSSPFSSTANSQLIHGNYGAVNAALQQIQV